MKIPPSVTGICLGSVISGLLIYRGQGWHPMNQIQLVMHGIKEDPSFLILMGCILAMLLLGSKSFQKSPKDDRYERALEAQKPIAEAQLALMRLYQDGAKMPDPEEVALLEAEIAARREALWQICQPIGVSHRTRSIHPFPFLNH